MPRANHSPTRPYAQQLRRLRRELDTAAQTSTRANAVGRYADGQAIAYRISRDIAEVTRNLTEHGPDTPIDWSEIEQGLRVLRALIAELHRPGPGQLRR